MNILLADDDPNVRAALRLLFEHDRDMHVVGEACTGQALLAELGACAPDLILLDWELPDPDVPALVADIRRLCPTARVVALSGRIEAVRAALAAGVDAFASKGDPAERLLGTLHVLAHAPRNGDPRSTWHLDDAGNPS